MVERNRVTGVVVDQARTDDDTGALGVDCSGDADVAFYAGAEHDRTRKPDADDSGAGMSNIDAKTQRSDVSTAIKNGKKNHPLIRRALSR